MSNQILVPALGESIKEATVSKWLKQVGEEVDSDEPLVELETDKVNVEVPSPLSGTLSSNMFAIMKGVQFLRVHDVNEVNKSIKVFKSLNFK